MNSLPFYETIDCDRPRIERCHKTEIQIRICTSDYVTSTNTNVADLWFCVFFWKELCSVCVFFKETQDAFPVLFLRGEFYFIGACRTVIRVLFDVSTDKGQCHHLSVSFTIPPLFTLIIIYFQFRCIWKNYKDKRRHSAVIFRNYFLISLDETLNGEKKLIKVKKYFLEYNY